MAALPSGMVTFLFTDIEGSTPLWEHEPEQMRLALARHHAILRTAIAAHFTMGPADRAAHDRDVVTVRAALGEAAFAAAWAEGRAMTLEQAIAEALNATD